MEKDIKKTRREFLGDVIKTGSAAAVGGLVCIGLSPKINAVSSANDIISMTDIDPDKILCNEFRKPVSTGFRESRFIAADKSGVLYAGGDRSVRIIDRSGRITNTLELTVSPFCMAADDEHLYIGTKDNVVVSDKKGNVQSAWKNLGENAWITGIALDDRFIFIADAGQRIVWCYDLKGNFIRTIGKKDPERDIPGFVVPGPYFDIAMAPDGLLRISNPGNHRIEAYTIKGDREFFWGRFGNRLEDFTACCNPVSLTVLSNGDTVTCEKGVARVKVYDTFGNLKGFVAEPKNLANVSANTGIKTERVQRYGFDITADDHGSIFILDRARNVIRFFRPKKA